MKSGVCAIVVILFGVSVVGAQTPSSSKSPGLVVDSRFDEATEPRVAGPIKDVTYQIVWLIETDDANRMEYDGPASKGLKAAGYGRLVPAGSATAAVTIGQSSTITGTSRYGQMSVLSSFLNTTENGELQVKIQLRTMNQSPFSVESTMRAPLDRWFLLGSADSRVGLPKHIADGKRGVAIMKVSEGVLLLDDKQSGESSDHNEQEMVMRRQ